MWEEGKQLIWEVEEGDLEECFGLFGWQFLISLGQNFWDFPGLSE